MNNIWIEVCFDGELMDNLVAHNIKEAEQLIKIVEQVGFSEYNQEVKDYWLKMGFRNNPDVTARISH